MEESKAPQGERDDKLLTISTLEGKSQQYQHLTLRSKDF